MLQIVCHCFILFIFLQSILLSLWFLFFLFSSHLPNPPPTCFSTHTFPLPAISIHDLLPHFKFQRISCSFYRDTTIFACLPDFWYETWVSTQSEVIAYIFLSCRSGVMVQVLNYSLEVSKFEPQEWYYVHIWTNSFGKGMNPLTFSAMSWIVSLLFFYKNGFLALNNPPKLIFH